MDYEQWRQDELHQVTRIVNDIGGTLDVSFGGGTAQLSVGDAYPEDFYETGEKLDELAQGYEAGEEDDFDLDAFDRFFDREAERASDQNGEETDERK